MPWEETPAEFAERLHVAVKHINDNFDVRGLCMELPDRLEALVSKTKRGPLAKVNVAASLATRAQIRFPWPTSVF